jgi:hypothetical protein
MTGQNLATLAGEWEHGNMGPNRGDVTLLLAELTKGIEAAASKLIPLVYAELRRLAGNYMRRERVCPCR